MYHMNGFHWGMGVGWFLFAGILFLALWIIARFVNSGNPAGGNKNSALDILNKRYARGEIGKEEYLDQKQSIS